ncbi:hypothetical protein GOP47_0017832 [Adiantum capillus-veneris]|uniref:Protein kinase domain-containing protein n=1 Tax=Adiantum capillus-veneris TaxID=13818 RepID=A0A9D4UH38_ADICA|nr:hypothetical protein GOP47_0017832 [Adiantum capillus-veneris]
MAILCLSPLYILIPSLLNILPFFRTSTASGVAHSALPSTPLNTTCSSECGPLSNISYPFSVMSPKISTSSCGLPEFRIFCNDSFITWWPEPLSQPISSILNITSNYITSGTFVILAGPPAFSPLVDACSSLQQGRFLFSSASFPLPLGVQFSISGNIVLLTNCSNDLTSELRANETINGFSFSSPRCLEYYSVCYNESSDVAYTTVPCLEAIAADVNIVQMSKSYQCQSTIVIYRLPKPKNRALALQVSWTISQSYYDCKACKGSNGTCSLNNVTDSFQCMCPNSADEFPPTNICNFTRTPHSCKGLCQSNFQIIIGVAIGIFIGFVAASFGICCRWHRRAMSIQEVGQLAISMQGSTSKEQDKYMLACEASTIPDSIRKFSYKELFAATNGFAENKVLGDGGFGTVYEGVLLCSGQKVAVKRLNSDNARKFEQFFNEIRIVSSLNHTNLVRLHGFCCESLSELLLVYEYACNGTLAENLHGTTRKGSLLWETRLSIASTIAAALAYMHQQNPPILHRDVKSSNILLSEKFHAKLADFGLSRKAYAMQGMANVSTAPQGTPGYVDPQYQECYRLADKSDVYSFGVVLMELISGKAPIDMSGYHGNDHINLSSLAVAKIQEGALHELIDPALVEHDSGITQSTLDMVSSVAELAFLCLAPLQDDRPSMSSVALTLLDIAQRATDPHISTASP